MTHRQVPGFKRNVGRMTIDRFLPGALHATAMNMSRRHKHDDPENAPTLHRWTARHYIISAVIILLAVGAFAYSWS